MHRKNIYLIYLFLPFFHPFLEINERLLEKFGETEKEKEIIKQERKRENIKEKERKRDNKERKKKSKFGEGGK